jgi:hypothetical protein
VVACGVRRARVLASVVAFLGMRALPAQAEPSRVAHVVFRANDDEAVLQTDWAPGGAPANVAAPSWSVVCAAPCAVQVHADARFRATGRTLYDSPPFVLPPNRASVVVTAEMATKSMVAPALLLVAGYATLGVLGPLLIGTGLAAGDEMGPRTRTGLIVSGSVVAGVGVALAATGVVMIVKRAQRKASKVELARGGAIAF